MLLVSTLYELGNKFFHPEFFFFLWRGEHNVCKIPERCLAYSWHLITVSSPSPSTFHPALRVAQQETDVFFYLGFLSTFTWHGKMDANCKKKLLIFKHAKSFFFKEQQLTFEHLIMCQVWISSQILLHFILTQPWGGLDFQGHEIGQRAESELEPRYVRPNDS